MTLYDIDTSIMNLIDIETGEIADFEAFEKLQIDRQRKVENIALAYKNVLSDAEQLKAEKEAFAERELRAKKTAESLKNYLAFALNGETYESAKVKVSYRKSKALIIDEGTVIPEAYTKTKIEPDKIAIKNAISNGAEINGCRIEEKQNIQIK